MTYPHQIDGNAMQDTPNGNEHGYFTGRFDLTPRPQSGPWWSKTLYDFRLSPRCPLTYHRGTFRAQPDRHFVTDGGSIPRIVQLIPALQKDRYWRAYAFHDSAYRNGCFYVWKRVSCLNQSTGMVEFTWRYERRALTRAQADLWLREMLLAEGASIVTARVVYRAVRMFGWIAWKGGKG